MVPVFKKTNGLNSVDNKTILRCNSSFYKKIKIKKDIILPATENDASPASMMVDHPGRPKWKALILMTQRTHFATNWSPKNYC